MSKIFAQEYSKNERGWYIFPADANYRRQLFPMEVMEHIARANLYLVQAVVEYVSEPEETILDVMAGSGSIMVAALIGRRVIMIEIEPPYCLTIQAGIDKLETIAPGISTQITLIPGDANKILPIPNIDHIIFSPPYAQIMRMSGTASQLQADKYGESAAIYSQSDGNVGRLNEFFYNQIMERIYKKCYDSLKPGGTMTIIIKDHIDKKKVYLSDWVIRRCSLMGFKLKDWFKWMPHGTAFLNIWKSKGVKVVEEEEIIILEKPND
jgi:DNA modification methylase